MEFAHIGCASDTIWTPMRKSIVDGGHWFGPISPFPLAEDHWLGLLIDQFVAIYPMLDTARQLARGRQERLTSLIDRFRASVETMPADDLVDEQVDEGTRGGAEADFPAVDEETLDSYHMLRPGKWYTVLARDRWTCCSCGRSTRESGVLLEVDHIIPRSKGGTDDLHNLQTLCKKCNVGKSNGDQMRLTAVE